jgi:[ribosomal protein S18]-alanine N-acetyltransferase
MSKRKICLLPFGVCLSCAAVNNKVTEIFVRPLCERDLDRVLAIECASFSRPWTRRHFLDEIASPFGIPLVAQTSDGCIAGYLCLKLVLDEAEILDVAVDLSLRGRGIGRILVESALNLCRERQAALLGLEVRVGNQAATALYRRLGFRESGVRKRYYEDGEDAMLMDYIFDDTAKECDAV